MYLAVQRVCTPPEKLFTTKQHLAAAKTGCGMYLGRALLFVVQLNSCFRCMVHCPAGLSRVICAGHPSPADGGGSHWQSVRLGLLDP